MPVREVALSPPPGFRLPSLAGITTGVTAQPDEVLELHALHFDTPDFRLTRAGASLARRSDDWVLDLPGTGARDFQQFPAAGDDPPDAALDLVCALVRGAPLEPVARLKTRRRRIELANGDREQIAQVVDDEVTVLDGTRITTRFRELDIAAGPDAPEALVDALVARLRSAGAAPAPSTPRLARALGPAALAPPDVAPPSALGPTATVRAAIRATIMASVARLVAHDPGIRLGEDPEPVHQARVATRRLRSDLRTFRSLLEPSRATALREELRWLGAMLGGVREVEVMRDLLRSRVALLPLDERPIGDELLDQLAVARHQARIELLEAIRGHRYVGLLDRLVEAAHTPPLRPGAEGAAIEVLPRLVRGPWGHLDRAVGALPAEPPDAALHDLRIRAKRLRYAAEAIAPVAGRPLAELGRRAAALQDVLGRHQDAVVASGWLRDVSRNASTRPEAFTAGELAGLVRAEEIATRAEWPEVWRRLEKKAHRALR